MYYERTLNKRDSNDPVEVAMGYGVCGVENGSSISYKRVMWLVIKKSWKKKQKRSPSERIISEKTKDLLTKWIHEIWCARRPRDRKLITRSFIKDVPEQGHARTDLSSGSNDRSRSLNRFSSLLSFGRFRGRVVQWAYLLWLFNPGRMFINFGRSSKLSPCFVGPEEVADSGGETTANFRGFSFHLHGCLLNFLCDDSGDISNSGLTWKTLIQDGGIEKWSAYATTGSASLAVSTGTSVESSAGTSASVAVSFEASAVTAA